MKPTVLAIVLASSASLLAQEPAAVPSSAGNQSFTSQELAEQAALVQEIGGDAAKDFDPERHARELRQEVQALIGASTATNSPAAQRAAVPARSRRLETPLTGNAPASARPGSEVLLRRAIQQLRAALNELESQMQAESN